MKKIKSLFLLMIIAVFAASCTRPAVSLPTAQTDTSFEVITSKPAETTESTATKESLPETTESNFETTEPDSNTVIETTTETETVVVAPVEPVEISLVAVGDMLLYGGTHNRAQQADGSYDYSFIFEHTKEQISAADLAIANQEVILGGVEIGIGTYPGFNSPQDFGDYLVDAGFDVIEHASNHTFDKGVDGVINTIHYWKEKHPDITYLGISETAEEREEIPVVECKGIRIAMLNYTYGLNGYSLPADMPYLINLMNESTKPDIARDIQKAREISDFVIVFPHWGNEYELHQNSPQAEWAQFFADNGADLIIGAHPHVIEPVEWIKAGDGRDVLVYYSLGNFNSIQYYNYSMLGGFAKVTICKDENGTYISDNDMDFLVTHYTVPNPNRNELTTYFLSDYTEELAGRHAILTEPYDWERSKGKDTYTVANRDFPFTIEGLWNIARFVCPDFVNR